MTAQLSLPAQPWPSPADAALYRQVEQRVVAQLLQTLIYEEVLSAQVQPMADGLAQYRLAGRAADGQPVQYLGYAPAAASFGLIRLDPQRLVRQDAQGSRAPTLHETLAELLGEQSDSPLWPRFVQELEQTLLKDLQSRRQDYRPDRPAHELDVDELERHFMDAHGYHPCYKSRIGFSLAENRRYGPEFGEPIQLVWLALARERASVGHSSRLDFPAFIAEEFGAQRWVALAAEWREQGRALDDYQLIPVHPWQWEQHLAALFQPELVSGELLYLGTSRDQYAAQQSIRTLANRSAPRRPYVKLAMCLTNTSSTRILARHTVLNGPIITDWLQRLIETDATARDLDFVVLGEVAGVAYDSRSLPVSRAGQVYGTLGAVWRESIHAYLRADEQAVPFNGLTQVEHRYGQGAPQPFVAAWIERHGLDAWLRQLLRVTVTPLMHMLHAEGIGMESHGQNIVLIHRDGWPLRIALKDFHDGVRYAERHLARPELRPTLEPLPASHARINRNSFILTEDVEAVRDFTCDAFFFIALGELAVFLRQHFALAEADFWQATATVILDYQRAHPQHQERYALFDVFAPTFEVEELTKRRLLGDGERRFKAVANPLHPYRPAAC